MLRILHNKESLSDVVSLLGGYKTEKFINARHFKKSTKINNLKFKMSVVEQLKKYELARVGAEYAEKDPRLARKSLDFFIESLENVSEDVNIILKNSTPSEEDVKKILSALNKKYEEAYKKASLNDFFELYGGNLKDSQKKFYQAIISGKEGMTLEDINKKANDISKTLEKAYSGKEELSTDEIRKLRQEIADYSQSMLLINQLDNLYFLRLRKKIEDSLYKDAEKALEANLKSIALPLSG